MGEVNVRTKCATRRRNTSEWIPLVERGQAARRGVAVVLVHNTTTASKPIQRIEGIIGCIWRLLNFTIFSYIHSYKLVHSIRYKHGNIEKSLLVFQTKRWLEKIPPECSSSERGNRSVSNTHALTRFHRTLLASRVLIYLFVLRNRLKHDIVPE